MFLFSSKLNYLIILLIFILNKQQINAKWAFLSDQTKCNLNCLNGGVCSFMVNKPEIHKCICLIGMYEGNQCEIAIDQSITTTIETFINNEEEEEEENKKENEEDEEELEEEIYEDNNNNELNLNKNHQIYGKTQHFIEPEVNTLSSINLDKFESWPRPFSSLKEEDNNEEKTKKLSSKNLKRKKSKKITTTTIYPPYEEFEGKKDGWMVTRRGGNSYYSSSSFDFKRRKNLFFIFIGGIIFYFWHFELMAF